MGQAAPSVAQCLEGTADLKQCLYGNSIEDAIVFIGEEGAGKSTAVSTIAGKLMSDGDTAVELEARETLCPLDRFRSRVSRARLQRLFGDDVSEAYSTVERALKEIETAETAEFEKHRHGNTKDYQLWSDAPESSECLEEGRFLPHGGLDCGGAGITATPVHVFIRPQHGFVAKLRLQYKPAEHVTRLFEFLDMFINHTRQEEAEMPTKREWAEEFLEWAAEQPTEFGLAEAAEAKEMLQLNGPSTKTLDNFLEMLKSGKCPLKLPCHTRHLLGQVREFTIATGSREQVLKMLSRLLHRHVHGQWSSAALLHPIDGIKVFLNSKDAATDLHLVDCAGVPAAYANDQASFDGEAGNALQPGSVNVGDLHRLMLTKGVLENGFAALVHVISNNRAIPAGLSLVMDLLLKSQQVAKMLHNPSMYKLIVLNMIDKEMRPRRNTQIAARLLDRLKTTKDEGCSQRTLRYREKFEEWIMNKQQGEQEDNAWLIRQLDDSHMLESLCTDVTGTIYDSAKSWSADEEENFREYRLETLVEVLMSVKSRTEGARLDQVLRLFPLVKEVVASCESRPVASALPQSPSHSEAHMVPFEREVDHLKSSLCEKYSKLATPQHVRKVIDRNWVLDKKKKFRADLVSEKTRLPRLILPTQLVDNSIDDIATELIRAAKTLLQGLSHVSRSRQSFLISTLERELVGNSTRAQALQEEAFKALRSHLREIWEQGKLRQTGITINEHTAHVLAEKASLLARIVVDIETQQMAAIVSEVLEDCVNEPEPSQRPCSGPASAQIDCTEDDLVDRFYRFLAEGFGEHEITGDKWGWSEEFLQWQRDIKRNPGSVSRRQMRGQAAQSLRPLPQSSGGGGGGLASEGPSKGHKQPHDSDPLPTAAMVTSNELVLVQPCKPAAGTSTADAPIMMQPGEPVQTVGKKRKAEAAGEVIDLTGD